MNIYEVVNGWIGMSYTRVYVIAATDERALELARNSFRMEDETPDYYNDLRFEIVGTIDANQEVVSVPSSEGWEETR